MIQENPQIKKKRTLEIIKRLKVMYPEAKIELVYKTPMQLVAATILSAQCTDKRVNLVTADLFKTYKTAEHFAKANLKRFEQAIKSTGFYRAKAKNIIGCAKELCRTYGGKVPNQMEDLIQLPGIGRKTANVILGNIYDTPGIVVDTHVIRIANRLALTSWQDPHKIEMDLCELVPKKDWTLFSHLVIWHGRRRCFARKPICPDCRLNTFCPSRQDLSQIPVGFKHAELSAH